MSYIDHIQNCNNLDKSGFVRFNINGVRVGWVRRTNVEKLRQFGQVFSLTRDGVSLSSHFLDFKSRSAAVQAVIETLASQEEILSIRGEMYPVREGQKRLPLMEIERAACPYFGISTEGVHLNGFVRCSGGIHMWIARRSCEKATYPGLLDNMVAGGQPIGLALRENLIKECGEEAGIPPKIAKDVKPVGVITYIHESENGVKPDRQYCYDLELPTAFVPKAVDGEVDEFLLWPIERVAEIVRDTCEFKFNCNLVIIDFLIRHGYLDPDLEPDYTEICLGLHKETASYEP